MLKNRIFAVVLCSLPLLLGTTLPLLAQTPSLAPPQSFHATRNVRVIDADTVECDYQLFGSLWAVGETVRSDYDAWESYRTRRSEPFASFSERQWQAETVKGNAAKNDLVDLLARGNLYIAPTDEPKGIYGRTVARYYVLTKDELVDVRAWMEKRGHLRNESPRRPQQKE